MHSISIFEQVRTSIPVVRAGEESRFPGLPYVIFPGNTQRKKTFEGMEKVEDRMKN